MTGVNWFAPFHHYGEPDDLRRFIDRAHGLGLGVILDVVYNHFGQLGNSLPHFAHAYIDTATLTPWGAAPNFSCEAMRQLVIDNAVYWIREFHFDGLRLDATHSLKDPQYPQLLSQLIAGARAAAHPRTIVVSGEDYMQRAALLGTTAQGGAGLDQLWNDDFHHAARVALTGIAMGTSETTAVAPRSCSPPYVTAFCSRVSTTAGTKAPVDPRSATRNSPRLSSFSRTMIRSAIPSTGSASMNWSVRISIAH